MIDLADRQRAKADAGHNAQCTPAMVPQRGTRENGYLGGKPVTSRHLRYDLKDQRYAVGPAR